MVQWNHQMSQAHIGYDNWQQPEANRMPAFNPAEGIGLRGFGVAVEGDTRAWPGEGEAILPELSPYGPDRHVEVFMRVLSKIGEEFEVQSAQPWVKVSPRKGTTDTRLTVSVDWRAAPAGRHHVPITISGPDSQSVVVTANVFKPAVKPTPGSFVEAAGYVAIEAAHHSRAVGANDIEWREIPGLGRGLSGVGAFPRTAPVQTPGEGTPFLEYPIFLTSEGARDVQVHVDLAPTLNFRGGDGLRYAVSIDDQPPEMVNIHLGSTGKADDGDGPWNRWVVDNVNRQISLHRVSGGGAHTLRLWLVDPGLVFHRVVVATQPLPNSVLGPPESVRAGRR